MGFQALEVGVEMVAAVKPLVVKIRSACNAGLADQLQRAVESTVLNLAEARWRAAKDRTNRYRYAGGSADEADAAIRCAIQWGHVTAEESKAALELLDRVKAMLYVLIHGRKRR